MASITTILNTDSLASSRIVLNDNFAAINDQVGDLAALLNVTAQSLTLTGGVNASSLSLSNGGSNLLLVNSSDVIASVPVTLEDSLTLEAGFVDSVSTVSDLPAANLWTKTTYVLDQAWTGALSAADHGQTITLIAQSGIITVTSGVNGITSNLVIQTNGSATLRYVDSAWYLLSYVNAAVTF